MSVLILDFDGVLCDGMDECMLVTWNGYHRKGKGAFGSAALAEIPSEFRDRFRRYRGYARTLGDFIVATLDADSHIETQQEFDAARARIPPEVVRDFVARVGSYRESARTLHAAAWLACQPLLPGVVALLGDSEVATYIVTGKDAASVVQILRHHGVGIDPQHVVESPAGKLPAFERIASSEGVARSELWIIDDSVTNLVEAHASGFRTLWAGWGYVGRGDDSVAKRHGIRRVDPDVLATKPWKGRGGSSTCGYDSP